MKIAIIGGGFTGLAAAWELTKTPKNHIVIFEGSEELGGLASGFKEPKFNSYIEKAYHHWFYGDMHVKKLIAELGKENKLLFKTPKTVSYFKGSFYQLDSPLALLKFPGLNIFDKFKFAFATLRLKLTNNWQKLEQELAFSWLTKHYGQRTYKLIWEPLLKGKFGAFYKEVNMAWMWARVKARTKKLGTYKGGFQVLLNDWEEALIKRQVEIRKGVKVSKIEEKDKQLMVDKQAFDKVICTSSPMLFTQMVGGLKSDYLKSLENLKSLGAMVLVLILKKPISDQKYYWFNVPKGREWPMLSIVEHTNFVDAPEFDNKTVVYLGDYLDKNDKNFKLEKDEVIKLYAESLKKIKADFKSADIESAYLYKFPYAQPIPVVNMSKLIPSIRTPIKNLYLASMSQVYPWDRGTNYAIELGKRAAELVLST